MQKLTSSQLRKSYLDFFKDHQHKVGESAPMVVKNDPTLMFTNAGMNQFKDIFLGNKNPKDLRVANSQKCLRVSGKHNDLEEVGVDTYHHTMFEMLGNWSFGDYFKKDAIDWAHGFLVEKLGFDKERLYATVFEGDKQDGLGADEEAKKYWLQYLSEDKVLLAGKKDNFWEMGETGPCGPCSELHVDLRSQEERKKLDGAQLVNADHPEVIEVWNLVFMEFNRKEDGSLIPLPSKHVDTGMGFERLCMVMQGVKSSYDSDLFQPLLKKIGTLTNNQYGNNHKTDIAMRVIVDHVRAVSFSIADGQLPSNTGAGYVIRRILRRAVRYAYSTLNYEMPLLNQLVSVLVETLGDHFNELKAQQDLITRVICEEEESFLKTLNNGIQRFNQYVEKGDSKKIDGKFAFELYDTFGFPIDLTRLMASEIGWTVDETSFEKLLEEQKTRSRAAGKVSSGDWTVLMEDEVEEFVGYDYTEVEVKITRYRKASKKGKDYYQLAFNLTPFYPEGGGQIGDSGTIKSDSESIKILDTQKENDLIIHVVSELPQKPNLYFVAQVNTEKRHLTANNHSATHLLHKALRDTLGDHVAQKGSLVAADHLRFDFSHFSKMTEDEIKKVEQQVNAAIRQNILLEEHRQVPISRAKKMGAMALFGEKYGDTVRVIQFGDSIELCGGIHIPATGQIGAFRITQETSVAAGIRRIVAVTNAGADEFVNQKIEELDSAYSVLKHPKNLVKAIEDLKNQNNDLQKQIEGLQQAQVGNLKGDLLAKAETVSGVQFVGQTVELSSKAIKDLAFQLKNESESLMLALGNVTDGKVTLSIMISEDLVKSKGLKAGDLIREVAPLIKGGGGGQPFFATAGGKNPEGLAAAYELIRAKLG